MLQMMLEVVILTNCVPFIAVLDTVPLKGMPADAACYVINPPRSLR
jgi:hypothetical protein